MADVTTALRAGYVIEVLMHHQTKRANIAGNITVYKKGGEYGNSDASLDMCGEMKCLGVFRDAFYLTAEEREEISKLDSDHIDFWPASVRERYDTWGQQLVSCPVCRVIRRRNALADTYGFNTTLDNIVLAVTGYFRVLDSNADIVQKIARSPTGLQKAKRALQDSGKLGQYKDDLEKARQVHHVFYPLSRLLTDAANGSSIEACIRSFLKA